MILEDFVMLGTTVPEPRRKDQRITVCSAGVSAELGSLVRVYPLARRNAPHRWDIHRVQLERSTEDNRAESWKIAGPRSPEVHPDINERFKCIGTVKRADHADLLRANALKRHVVGSIREANARQISLAIIHPQAISLEFEHNPDSPDSPQLALFDRPGEPPSGARRFAWMPRLIFQDEDRSNRLMLRDWGVFELQRKHGGEYFRKNLADALTLSDNSSLLVGNMRDHRNSWLVISVLNGIRDSVPTLFDVMNGAA